MTHRDGFPRLSASTRVARRCGASQAMRDAARKPWETTVPVGQANRQRANRCGRRKALTMPRRTRGFPPTRPLARRIACPISMGHYQRSLVLVATAFTGIEIGTGVRAQSGSSETPVPELTLTLVVLLAATEATWPGVIETGSPPSSAAFTQGLQRARQSKASI